MKVVKKNNKETFPLLLYLGSKYDGEAFEVYFSSGALLNKYVCSYDGTTYTHCSKADANHILCMIDNANLACGLLYASISIHYPEKLLDDGTYDIGDKRLVVGTGEDDEEYHIEITKEESDTISTTEQVWNLIGNIMRGEAGHDSVYIGEGDMPDDCNFQVDPSQTPLTEEDAKFVHIVEDDDQINFNKTASANDIFYAMKQFIAKGDVIVTAFSNIKTANTNLEDELDKINVTSIVDKDEKSVSAKTYNLIDDDGDTIGTATYSDGVISITFTATAKFNGTIFNFGDKLKITDDGITIASDGNVSVTSKNVEVTATDGSINIKYKDGITIKKSDGTTEFISVSDDKFDVILSDNLAISVDKSKNNVNFVAPEILWSKKVASKGSLKTSVTHKTNNYITGSYYLSNTAISLLCGETLVVDTDGHDVVLLKGKNISDQSDIIASDETNITYQAVKDMTVYIGTKEQDIYAKADTYNVGDYSDDSVSFSELNDIVLKLKDRVKALESSVESLTTRVETLEESNKE